MDQHLLKRLHGIYLRYSTTQKHVEEFIQGDRDLLQTYSQCKGDEIADFLIESGCDADIVRQVRERINVPHFYDDLTVKKLETTIKRNSRVFVEPREFVLDYDIKHKRRLGKWERSLKKKSFHYFSVRDTIVNVLTNKEIFDDIASERRSNDGLLRKDIDGSVLAEEPDLMPTMVNGKLMLTIRILMYSDEFEPCNPLSSSKKIHKLNGFYFKILNMKPSGKLKHVYVYAIAKADLVNMYGYDAIFFPYVNEMEELANGEDIFLHGQQVFLKYKFIGLTGDSLGLPEMLKAMPPGANRFCRDCYIERPIHQQHPYLLGDLRTEENFAELLRESEELFNTPQARIDFLRQNGYQDSRASILTKLGFKPRNNRKWDKMHDYYEGVTMLIMVCILRYCFKKNIFRAAFINRRIKAFDWGEVNSGDKPADNIDEASINKSTTKKLCQTAAQSHLLLRAFPLLISDKMQDFYDSAERKDKEECAALIKLLSLHLQMVRIVCSRVIAPGTIEDLERITLEHNVLFSQIRLFFDPPLNCINKLHHLLHYPQMMREWGPAPLAETSRFEGEHQPLKERVQSSKNTKNVSKTATDRVAMVFSYDHSYEHKEAVLNPMGSFNLKDAAGNVTFASGLNMTFHGIHYQAEQVLCVSVGDDPDYAEVIPSFGQIVDMEYSNQQLVFTINCLETQYFDTDYCAYRVEMSNNQNKVTWDELEVKYPQALWHSCTDYPEDEEDFISAASLDF